MTDYKISAEVIAAARKARESQDKFRLGKLVAAEIDAGATTADLIALGRECGSSLRSLRYAITVYRFARQVGLSDEDVTRIGWTKLAVVVSGLEPDTIKEEVIALCEGRTVTQLRAAMAGIAGEVKIVTFSLNKTQRRELDAALMRHGAVRSGRALNGKEAALMKIISEAK